MKVLVVGGGGREHALAWKLAQSDKVSEVIVAPGNAGTASEPGMRNADVGAEDIDGLIELARSESAGLTVVGPEAPLAAGIVDRFTDAGLKCFGPSASAARLESSKAFAKAFMARHDIPTAAFGVVEDVDEGMEMIRGIGLPIVLKADGLAAGKGVVIAETEEHARATLEDMLSGEAFGKAGRRVVIEEFLVGEEASFIVVASGKQYLSMASSQDHKRRDDGDRGPNTGGMGAYSPAPVVDEGVHREIIEDIIEPTLAGLVDDSASFTGFLYAGVMLTATGPKYLNSTYASAIPKRSRSCCGSSPTWSRSSSTRSKARSTKSLQNGTIAPPWRWSWPPAAIPAATRKATRSPGWSPTSLPTSRSSTPAPLDDDGRT